MMGERSGVEGAAGALRLLRKRIYGGHLVALLVASLIMIVGAIAANYPAVLSGMILDKVIRGEVGSFNRAIPFLLALAACYLVREIAAILRKFLVERTACNIERDELRRLSSFLLRLDMSAFWGQRIGALNVRIHRSLEGLVKLIKLVFLDLLPTGTLSIVALALTAQRSIVVFAVMIGVFAIAMALTITQVVTQRGIRVSLFAAKEEVSGNLTEVLMGLDYVRVAGGIEQEEERARELSARLRSQEFRHHKWMMSFDGGKQLLEGAGMVLVVAIGAWQVANGMVTTGDVLTLAMLYAAAATPLRDLHRILDEGSEGLIKVGQLAGLYALLPDRGIPGNEGLPQTLDDECAVRTQSVSLGIEDDDHLKPILREVTLTVRRGEWVGLAGGSGSGKTSLLKVLLGITPQYVGKATVLGVEVRDARKSDLWQSIGYVSQTPHIFNGTLKDNLLYGSLSETPTDEYLCEVLARAGLQDRFLVRGPACLSEIIQEQGRGLSGGERQRLAIARLFIRKPALIILDEATSALDYENEAKLVREIRNQFYDATAVVVAHRLEALRQTDRILVMRTGELVDEGPFSELSARDGEFRKIANLG